MPTESHAKSKEPGRRKRPLWRSVVAVLAESSVPRLRWGMCLMVLVAATGCVSVQQAVPALAPCLAGRMTCPNCGLLNEQGCPCHPDLWNHGYCPTYWRHMPKMILDESATRHEELPPALHVPSVGPDEVVPNSEAPDQIRPLPRPQNIDASHAS